ncbi:CDT1 domain-containing protein [Heracleum sosnowskyi]|uniref:CDT1 domain-containing protein n=1 Tax=Heracleum sosnowskyi TaxID=360622 RepID=A0AAD8M111_9APIA|nr:CDT1 domain-containing protein [Heracleum sosnowskyi]
MDSAGEMRSTFDSFKSKKILNSTPKTVSFDESVKAPIESPWSSKTPEKSVNPTRRLRNRGAALSLKEVKQCAKKLHARDPETRPDPVKSLDEQISLEPVQSPAPKPKRSVKLPEQYEILDKLFSSLDSSIRLLRIKGTVSTFTNISPKMECLTDRRFSHGHLAQLKFVFPEAIEIEKILIRDERTCCMKPDLHVSLSFAAAESDGKSKSSSSNSGSLLLRKAFRARLFKFFEAHPKGDEVPEATLPEPFNKSTQGLLNMDTIQASNVSSTNQKAVLSSQQTVPASHLSQSFRRGFSKRALSNEAGNTSQVRPAAVCPTTVLPVSKQCNDLSSEKEASKSIVSPVKSAIPRKSMVSRGSQACPRASCPPATPIKAINSTKNEVSSMASDNIQVTPVKSFSKSSKLLTTPAKLTGAEVTPAKSLSTPVKLMSATPVLQPPKRCYMSPDADALSSPNKLVRRPQRSRSLIFDTPKKKEHVEEAFDTPMKKERVEEATGGEKLLLDSDIFDILPENLLQSIREKEKKTLEDQDPAISQAKRRQQMIASLPKLFDMVHYFFQSIKRSAITKDELIHKIVANHLDIVDKREVEEQLRLLQELAPEWIYEKSAITGDLLLCINKISSPESVRSRLAEAR